MLEKSLGVENAIVGMVMTNSNTVDSGKSFKCFFCFDSFLSVSGLVYMNITEERKVVDKNGSDLVSFSSELASRLADEARDG